MLDSTTTSPKFIESAGGPLIVVGSANLSDWEGIDAPSAGRIIEAEFRWNGPGTPATDYDRACDVTDYIGVLAIGSGARQGDALVLGDLPLSTTVLKPDASSLPLIVRCDYTENERALLAALAAISTAAQLSEGCDDQGASFAVTSTPLYLFDAAIHGSEVANDSHSGGCLAFDLPIGTYRISRHQFDATEETRLDLYQFEQH